jgi:hypothetical protein
MRERVGEDVVATVSDLVERSAELKGELMTFSARAPYSDAFHRILREKGVMRGDVVMLDGEGEFGTLLDSFLLQHRLSDGRTLVEHFLDARPDITGADRELLLGWLNVVEGLFEVKGRDGEALVLFNLIDELTYRARSNMGPAAFAGMPRRSFLFTRLLPVGDEWLFSGYQTVLPASARREVARMAAESSLEMSSLVFRNPELVEKGWELQRDDRADFIEFFGADFFIAPGCDLTERIRAFRAFQQARAVERAGRADRVGETASAVPDFEPPPEMLASECVGVIYDEVEGLNFLTEFGRFAEAFDEPDRVTRKPHGTVVRGYLEDTGMSPLPFRWVAARDPEKASRVFRILLKRRDFSWESDGEALLRQRKPSYFDRPPLPSVVPATEIVLEYHRAGPQPPRRHPRKTSSRQPTRKTSSRRKGRR